MRASFIYHQITAIISIIATLYFFYNIKYLKVNSLFLLSISWGIHCIIHFLEEYMYDYEPISGRTIVHDKPVNRY